MSENTGSGENTGRVKLVREIYFPTYIFFKDLPAAPAMNGSLRDKIYAMREEDAVGIHRSNVKQAGAWHSRDDLNRLGEFDALKAEIVACVQEAFDDLHYDPDYEPRVDNMWANISPRHAFNRTHVHPGVIYSGVYYVQAPKNAGRIYFTDPRVQAQMLRPHINDDGRKQAHNWTEVYYEPVVGRLIVFPAWLMHEVEPNLSEEQGNDGDRISISFNLVHRRRQVD